MIRKEDNGDSNTKNIFKAFNLYSKSFLKFLNSGFNRIKNFCGDIKSILYMELAKIINNSKKIWSKFTDNILCIVKKFKIFINPVISKVRENLKSAYKKGFINSILSGLSASCSYLKNNKSLVLKLSIFVAPVAAITIMISTISYWNNLNYGLKLSCGGEEIATIQDEKTFEEASQMVKQRLVVKDENVLGITPTFELVANNTNNYPSPVEVCDKLIDQPKSIVERATGLYVNEDLIGTTKDAEEIESTLDAILKSYISNENQKVEFVQDVEKVDGLFPKESIISREELEKKLYTPIAGEEFYTVKPGDTPITIAESYGMTLDELKALNPDIDSLMHEGMQVKIKLAKLILEVGITDTESYEREVEFQTIEIPDDSEYKGYSKVTQEGENGVDFCVDKVTYVNGREESRETLSKDTIKEPINKNIVIGTKEKPSRGTGELGWPVPCTRNITSPFGPRWGRMHTGIDIGAPYGSNILAADNGVVKHAGSSGTGYGNYVEIDHGNGIRTLYAHANRIYVSVGDTVVKGQLIASVGSTGNSTGPHCHFEVIVKGVQVNPSNYL